MGLLARSGGRGSDPAEARSSLLRAAESKAAAAQEAPDHGSPESDDDDPTQGATEPAESDDPSDSSTRRPRDIATDSAGSTDVLKIHYRLDFSLLPDLLEASARRIVAEDGRVERKADGTLLITVSGLKSADATLAGSMFARAIARQCMESWLEGSGTSTKE